MREGTTSVAALLVGALMLAIPIAACAQSDRSRAHAGDGAEVRTLAAPATTVAAALPAAPEPRLTPEQLARYDDAARTAWRYVEQTYQPRTGFMGAHLTYGFGTVWDMASGMAALYSGHALGLIDDATYDSRIRRALQTLQTMPLNDGIAFNKLYNMETGALVDRNTRPAREGYGWSAIDLGRMLVWLKIIQTNQPQYAQLVSSVISRIRMDQLVKKGYLWGDTRDEKGNNTYQEGRLGYEQYAARGFELWGQRADRALDLTANAKRVDVLGHPLLADKRGDDKLTGEPFFMMGLELGWSSPMERDLSGQILAAQEERYRQTGQLTMVSEDAVNKPPYYFYYYCVYCDGKPFVVDAMGAPRPMDGPRWVSTKAGYAWLALFPGDYTWKVVQALAPAASPNGWAAGVYEGTNESTGVANLNTEAIVLESALYARTGRPLIQGGAVTSAARVSSAPAPAGNSERTAEAPQPKHGRHRR